MQHAIVGDAVAIDLIDGERCIGTVTRLTRRCGQLRWWVKVHGCSADRDLLGETFVCTEVKFIH